MAAIDIDETLSSRAARAVLALVEARARIFEQRPALLDVIRHGLSDATPEQLVAAGREIHAKLPPVRQRSLAIGVETNSSQRLGGRHV